MPTRTTIKTAVHILLYFLEHDITEEVTASTLQDELELDRSTIRPHLEELAEVGLFSIRKVGITKHFKLTYKLPKRESKRAPKKTKLQTELEKSQWQERVRFSNNPNEPTWELECSWPEFVEFAKGFPALDLVARFHASPDYRKTVLIGKCPRCNQVKHAIDFNTDFWICDVCFGNETVFRMDSEDA